MLETKELDVKITKFYYYSDPDNSNEEFHHFPIPVAVDDPSIPLPPNWHREKPDDKLKDAIWSIDQQAWIENDHNSQAEIIASQAKQISNLMNANEELTKADEEKNTQIDQLQRTIAQSNQATSQLGLQFNQFGTQVTKSLSKVTEAVNTLAEKVNAKSAEEEKKEGTK